MLKVILILVWLQLGEAGKPELKVYQKEVPSMEICQTAGSLIVNQQQTADPKFLGGLFADCVDLNEFVKPEL